MLKLCIHFKVLHYFQIYNERASLQTSFLVCRRLPLIARILNVGQFCTGKSISCVKTVIFKSTPTETTAWPWDMQTVIANAWSKGTNGAASSTQLAHTWVQCYSGCLNNTDEMHAGNYICLDDIIAKFRHNKMWSFANPFWYVHVLQHNDYGVRISTRSYCGRSAMCTELENSGDKSIAPSISSFTESNLL